MEGTQGSNGEQPSMRISSDKVQGNVAARGIEDTEIVAVGRKGKAKCLLKNMNKTEFMAVSRKQARTGFKNQD